MEGIQNFLQTLSIMQWSDYLDIILVAFLIYKLLPLIRTPSTMRIARTVLALVLVAWVTAEMKLHTLSWILNQFLAVGLLAFVVLFQPELRRMLDHLGSVKLRSFFGASKPVQEMDHVITQTVNACKTMSKTRTGALIVFARDQGLDEYIRQGVPIDGQVTEQLLRTIFFLNTDLHDKAVIIQNGRLAAARCKLPEAKDPMPAILKELGTRHNSAVGMTQVSDALVVVVSEQTGTISVAIDNMLKRGLTPESLEKLLRKELCPDSEEEKNETVARNVLKKFVGQERADNGYEK